MAKITAKIRVGDYSSSDNSFDIKFQLRPASENGPEFTFTFGLMLLCIPDETRFWLAGFGLSDQQIRQSQEEVLEWLHKPRTRLGGTWYDLIWGRIELAIKIEKERRGKAEAERILVAAPCLDWAMEALDELEAEHGVVVGSDPQDRPAGKPTNAIKDEWTNTTFFTTPLKDDRSAAKALRAGMETARKAMEAAGLGEEPAKVVVPEGYEVTFAEPNEPVDL